jgi:hypothetical protein
VTLRPPVLDLQILAVDKTGFLQTVGESVGRMARKTAGYPITGTAGCRARAASGHTAAPPRSVMNPRRFIPRTPSMRSTGRGYLGHKRPSDQAELAPNFLSGVPPIAGVPPTSVRSLTSQRLPLATIHPALRPAQRLVGLDRVADGRQLALFIGAIRAAVELVGALDEEGVESGAVQGTAPSPRSILPSSRAEDRRPCARTPSSAPRRGGDRSTRQGPSR